MRTLGIAVALALVSAAPLSAQSNPQVRQGLAISLGLGSGSANMTCSGCESDRRNSGTGYLRIGAAVTPSLVVSAESDGWVKSEDGADGSIGYFMGVAQYYPAPAMGFFLKGGLGLGRLSLEETDVTGTQKLTSTGLGYQLGVGYDWRVMSSFSLTPFVNYLATAGAEAKFNGQSTGEKLNANVMQFGVGFTWH